MFVSIVRTLYYIWTRVFADFFFSSRRRHTRCALVTGVQTCALPISFTIGCSVALFGPAWQASVAEQVPPAHLGEAVALNSISYNVARSFGPAIGGSSSLRQARPRPFW